MTTTTTTAPSFLAGVDDFLGGVLNSNTAQGVLDIYKQKTAADIARDKAKADAAADAARMKAAQLAASGGTATGGTPGGGFPTKYVLYGVAGALGLGLVIWAATRRA